MGVFHPLQLDLNLWIKSFNKKVDSFVVQKHKNKAKCLLDATNLFVGETKRLKLDLTVLLVHGEPVEVHVAGHVVVDPAGGGIEGIEIIFGINPVPCPCV